MYISVIYSVLRTFYTEKFRKVSEQCANQMKPFINVGFINGPDNDKVDLETTDYIDLLQLMGDVTLDASDYKYITTKMLKEARERIFSQL